MSASSRGVYTLSARAEKRWREYLEWSTERADGRCLFRGHAEATYKLVPKIGRDQSLYWFDTEVQLLNEFRRRGSALVSGQGYSTLDWMAIAQHFGLPTRLLDWSESPLVALHFALLNDSKEAAEVVALEWRTLISPSSDGKTGVDDPFSVDRTVWQSGVAVVSPPALAARITNQRGAFTLHDDPQSDLEDVFAKHAVEGRDKPLGGEAPLGRSSPLERFKIDSNIRLEMQRVLFRTAFDHSFINADLEGLCAALNWRYKHNEPLGVLSDLHAGLRLGPGDPTAV